MNGVDTSLTVEAAKRTAMDMERELAAMIPTENVASIDQHPTGVLMSCEGDRAYQWTGRTNVIVQGAPDAEAIVESIVAEYSSADSFTAKLETTVDGQPSAHVFGRHGAGYLIARSVDGDAIEIISFSPCFVLPDDMSPGGAGGDDDESYGYLEKKTESLRNTARVLIGQPEKVTPDQTLMKEAQ